jgi:hypothetical protein
MTANSNDVFSCITYLAVEGQRIEQALYSMCARDWDEATNDVMRLYLPLPRSSVLLTHVKDGQLIQQRTIARL